MIKSILHLGAHRTATTSLQNFLHENSDLLSSNKISFLCPPQSRVEDTLGFVASKLETWSATKSSRLLISEENLLGTMEHNLEKEQLYPNAKHNLSKLGSVFQPDVVTLSIRELGEYWASAILFCYSRDRIPFPNSEKLNSLSKQGRSWKDVVNDVASVFPKSQIFVREFECWKDNPKRYLKQITNWNEWNETKLHRRVQNARPGEDQIVSKLLDNKDFQGLIRLGNSRDTLVFSEGQRQVLYDRYQNDLEALWATLGTSLLEKREYQKGQASSAKAAFTDTSQLSANNTVLLRIGKSGDDFLKSMAENAASKKKSFFLGGHGDTLVTTIKKFGRRRKLAFFFRPPEQRFVSGFLSRLRQGRPIYDVVWSPAEAIAFSTFRSPNSLAEALFSKDEYLKSAARFSMESILHLKNNYSHFLHSVDALRYEVESKNILVCCEVERIEGNYPQILENLGLSTDKALLAEIGSRQDLKMPELTELAKGNLRKFWCNEYKIYEECKTVAARLGF